MPISPLDAARAVLSAAEDRLDALKARIGDERAPVVVAYRGHATDRALFLKGRVLEDPGLAPADPDASLVSNARDMLRRFESDEIAGARVRASFGAAACEVTSDEEGYIRIHLDLDAPLPSDAHVHEVRLDLLGTPRQPGARATTTAEVLGVLPSATVGVISDVDDTVLQTGATRMLTMLRTTVFLNARTRLPFPGVAAFYRALAYGTASTMDNPVFYLSSSPWNLYDVIAEFLDHQGLPRGPLFLRDLGLTPEHFIKSGHGDHKLAVIADLLATHPRLPFVLIGDSGQHDPEIYAEAARLHPGRIAAIYLRDVSDAARDADVNRLIARVEASGVPVRFVPDSLAAARHAATIGLIASARLADVEADAAKDTAPGGTEV